LEKRLFIKSVQKTGRSLIATNAHFLETLFLTKTIDILALCDKHAVNHASIGAARRHDGEAIEPGDAVS
jgi:hypothetical protein